MTDTPHKTPSPNTGSRDAADGKTLPRQDDDSAPRLPHERDESSDQQSSENAEHAAIGKQAHADKQNGLVDTDRGPVLDKVYNEKIGRGAEGVADDRKRDS